MNIYDLKFGEHQWFSEMNCDVLRVPGGWLFREYTVDIGIIACSTFVPFNNEFMENSDQKEAETQPITQQGRLEDSAQICPFCKGTKLYSSGMRNSEIPYSECTCVHCSGTGKLLPC